MTVSWLGTLYLCFFFFFSSRRRHTRYWRDWSSDVCSSDLLLPHHAGAQHQPVGDDFRLLRGLAQDRQEKAGQAHQRLKNRVGGPSAAVKAEIGRASCRERV